jgi:ribose transport system permease protein
MSFVWLGIAVLILPTPGGTSPGWVKAIMGVQIPLVPFPIVAALVIGIVVHLFLMTSSYGAVLRGAGGNARSVGRAGWSLLKIKVVMYSAAGFFGVLSGLALIGLTSAADAHIADRYTLYAIAGVILGGGEFVGGRVSPIGAVLGALTLALAPQLMGFMKISTDWQIGAQGGILIIVLALRALINRREG